MRMLCLNTIGVFVCMCLVTLCASRSEWEFFSLAQAWPPGKCADAVRDHHKCDTGKIDSKIHTWTLHGLWPSSSKSKGPSFCNKTMKFNLTQVNSILDNLTIYWPNLYTDTNLSSLWDHEWSRHGTCCLDYDETAGELKYFTAALMLNQKYNITRMLANNNVVPSTIIEYSFDQFISSIKKEVGYAPIIDCAVKKLKNGTDYHLISQIHICLNKDFTPRSCDSDFQPIRNQINVQYNNDHGWWHRRRENRDNDPPQSTCPKRYSFYYPPIHGCPE